MNYRRIKKLLGVCVVACIIASQFSFLKADHLAGRTTNCDDHLQQIHTLQKSLHNAVTFTAKANQ